MSAAEAALPGFLKVALRAALPLVKSALITVAAPLLIDQAETWARGELTPVEQAKLRDVLEGLATRLGA